MPPPSPPFPPTSFPRDGGRGRSDGHAATAALLAARGIVGSSWQRSNRKETPPRDAFARLSAPSPWTVRGGPRRRAPWSDSHSPTAPHALRPALSQPRQFRPDFARPPPPGGGITAAGSSASPPMNGGRSSCISPFGAHSLSLLRQFPSRAYLNHFSLRCCGAGRGCHARPSRRQLPAEGVVSDTGYDRHQDSRHHRRHHRRGPVHDFV